MTFARGKEALARRAAKAARPKPLVAKATGERLAPKDTAPWRNDEHKRRVVACGCMVARHGPSFARSPCWGPIDPHHVTLWRQGWGQPSDALCVPLCRRHHDEAHEGIGKERGFQARYGIDFARWIERHSAVECAEIAKIRATVESRRTTP